MTNNNCSADSNNNNNNNSCGSNGGAGRENGGAMGRHHGRCPVFHRNFECPVKARIASTVPDFKAKAVMPDGSISEISLSDYRGRYVLLYFYPLDFTFVCPSEILAFNHATKDFESKNVQLLACSVDSVFAHVEWRNKPVKEGGVGPIQHPMIGDVTRNIAKMFGVLHETEGIAFRGLFLIDREGVLRHTLVNDLPLGRSVNEALRMVDSLQHHEQYGEVCPANWHKGEKAMKATHEGVVEYLKTVPQ